MTRIKKRRSGKKKTSDQQRRIAGRRKARAEKKEVSPEGQQVMKDPVAKPALPHKKKYEKPAGGRRGARAANKDASFNKPHGKNETVKNDSSVKEPERPVQRTGKSRSAGALRVSAAKSVAGSFKPTTAGKKAAPKKKEGSPEKKAAKGFAPWNKNKALRKR